MSTGSANPAYQRQSAPHHRPARKHRRGTAVVEFALVLPLLVALLAGIWEVGRMIDAHQLLYNACREAGRQAASGKPSITEVQQTILDYLERAGISTAGMPLPVVANLTDGSRLEPVDGERLDRYRVTTELPLANFKWSPLQLITSNATSITVSVDWYSMKDEELVVSEDIPVL